MTSEVKNPSKDEMSMQSSGVTPDIRNSSNSVISDSESGVVKEITILTLLPNRLSSYLARRKASVRNLSTA
jgi:hypothetical protein